LGTMQPTSKFGELFQYSNLMAAAAGYTGAYVMYPQMEFGAAYDRAMQLSVFDPLQMKATTFDFGRARSNNHATAHSPDVDGKPAKALTAINSAVIPLRPAGGAWSSVRDMLRSEEHTSELQSRGHLVCRLLLEKKNLHETRRRSP